MSRQYVIINAADVSTVNFDDVLEASLTVLAGESWTTQMEEE
jgi:hypothetical protein